LGPQFARKFDLTLRFEQIFLTTLPAVLLILVSILYLRYYYRQPVRIVSGRILWLKFVSMELAAGPANKWSHYVSHMLINETADSYRCSCRR
jgi:hypothetical protein